jgi:hypothetical protein
MSGVVSENFFTFDQKVFDAEKQKIIDSMTKDRIFTEIQQRLDALIVPGEKETNYL